MTRIRSGTKPQTDNWRDMTNFAAFAIGSVYGYFPYMSAIAAQDVWTTWVFSCSTHTRASHDCSEELSLVRMNVFKVMAYLVALTPPTICPLLAHQEVTCSTNRFAFLVCFASKAKALQREHRCISKANPPIAHPTAFGLLNTM